MSVETKEKNDIPDLYKLLGITIDVCKQANCDELIEKAYYKRAKACHPDKHPGRKDVEEVFRLLTMSYDILKNEKERTAYNHKLSLEKQSSGDFFKLKKSTQDYVKSTGEYLAPTDQQKLSFKDQMRELDSKRGYDRDPSLTDPINYADSKKKMNELSKTRASQDRELKPAKLFDDGRFDLKRFNAAFDILNKQNDNSIVPHNGVPAAWNDMNNNPNFSAFDNLDNLYVEDNNRLDTSMQSYGNVDFGIPMQKLTKKDMRNIKGADYVDGHNIIDDNYYKDMKNQLRNRESDAKSFEAMTYGDFKKDDYAGYGILDQFGNFDDRLELDLDDNDIATKYDRLMAERNADDIKLGGQSQPLPQPQAKSSRFANSR